MLKDLSIDFSSNANNYRRLHGGGRGQAIAKAIGLKTYTLPITVIDATAGLGQDAFVLACLGCEVTLIERSPQIAALLTTALEHGAADPNIQQYIAKMRLIIGDAYEILTALPADQYPDVVYLDPMFPQRNKAALVKQELRVLKDLVGDDLDADKLLAPALKVAKKRVVVKRPRIAPYLNNIAPQHSYIGKANRFDIYGSRLQSAVQVGRDDEL
jgi:16S rRNA (guanine1516-N2)-methyltransferase